MLLTVYRSPRLEPLADRLIQSLRAEMADPARDPLQPSVVIVPGEGLRRWLRMRVADQLGICAGVRFPFMLSLLHEALALLVGKPAGGDDAWETPRMALAIAQALPDLAAGDAAFAPLRDYLAAGQAEPQARRMALAMPIAEAFDRYVAYRPEWVAAWERHEPGPETVPPWQPVLWRAMSEALGSPNLALLAEALRDGTLIGAATWDQLPANLHVIAPAAVPPLHWQVLSTISRHRDICVYGVTPFGEPPADGQPAPMLQICGRLARHQHELIAGLAPARLEELPGPSRVTPTLLDRLQAALQWPVPPVPAAPVSETDASVQILACHGRLRQVEVLRDALLGLLDAHPDLQPRDIAILTPDPSGFAPLIEAVFLDGADDPAGHAGGLPRLPVTIADRALQGDNPVADALLGLLQLAGGRVTVQEVFDWLAMPVVHTGAGLTADGVQTLQGWIVDSGIAWGLDAADRAHHGQPADDANTWAFGLRRLLLGYAMPGDGSQLFAGVLPYDQIGEGEAALLGRFAAWWRTVTRAVLATRTAHTLPAWLDLSESWLSTLMPTDADTVTLVETVRERLADLREDADRTGLTEPLDLATFRQVLEDRFRFSGVQPALLTGRITVCSLSTVRHLPFRVVCLLGLDEAAFPRSARQTSFDRVSADPRPGDRPADDEDRQLFLDAIMAARDQLLITYTGFDAKSNAERPMSLPVADLLDLLVDTVALQAGWSDDDARTLALRRQIFRPQPLQAFSPTAFGDGDGAVPAFDSRLLDGARRLQGKLRQGAVGSEPVPLLAQPLSPLDSDTVPVVTVGELTSFWQDPLRGLFRQRLDVELGTTEADLPEREPVLASKLDEYAIGERLLDWHEMDGIDVDALVRGIGKLPAGPQGAGGAAKLRTVATQLSRAAVASGASGPPVTRHVDLTVAGCRIVGTIDRVWPQGRIEARFGSIRATHLIAAWIRHLILHAADPAYQRPSCLIGRKEDLVRPPLVLRPLTQDEAAHRLALLLGWWQTGQTKPLLFFPQTSWAYAAAYREAVAQEKDDPHREAVSGLWVNWWGAFSGPPKPWAESQSPYLLALLEGQPRLVWETGFTVPGFEADLPGFDELALAIWGPYLEDGHDPL